MQTFIVVLEYGGAFLLAGTTSSRARSASMP